MEMKRTDWTEYYKANKSIWSTFTQKFTLSILVKTVETFFKGDAVNVVELGGGNSCFAQALCDKASIKRYDIIENNTYAAELFNKMDLKVQHSAIEEDLLTTSQKGSYDFCYSVGLIEHFRGIDIETVINKHFDMCRNGGVVLISFPTPTVKYRLIRGLMERMGCWRFFDEEPLYYRDVCDYFIHRGEVVSHFLNNKLPLTQYVVIAKKSM